MPDFAISPRAVHAVGTDLAGQVTHLVDTSRQVAAAAFAEGDGFETTAALARVRTAWQAELTDEAAHLGSVAEAAHQSASVMETAEADATAAADAFRRMIG